MLCQDMSGWLAKDASDAKVQVPRRSCRCDTLHTSLVIDKNEKKAMSRSKCAVHLGEHIGYGI